MPRPRRFLFLLLAATVVGIAIGVWLLRPRPIEPPAFFLIREGMTPAEVAAIFGRERDQAFGGGATGFPEIVNEWVIDDGGCVAVQFDDAGKVQRKNYIPPVSPPPFLDRIRGWFGL